jgi:uncharacterized protein (DUF427 family)
MSIQQLPDWARRGRTGWRFTGQERPPFAVPPKADQESVWDYPRPPRIVADNREVVVRLGPVLIARSDRAVRVLETGSPPTFYVPPEDVEISRLESAPGTSRCEWKGEARYWTVVAGHRHLDQAAWSYPNPFPEFESLAGYFSFYPGRLDCSVGGVRVRPQPGRFYGGWVTPEIVGPFKGEPGSEGW